MRGLHKKPSQAAVHDLRTASRKLEAISSALLAEAKPHKLLKAIKPVRKAAGKVRDMDVLIANVNALLRRHHSPSLERLLSHLRHMREESARHLARNFKSMQPKAQKRLQKFSKQVKKHCEKKPFDARQVHALFTELSHWPTLTQKNLHDFRINIKELRYMMQLVSGADPDFMKALDRTKGQIGTWHDWAELHAIANEFLNAESDKIAVEVIADEENKRLKSAMRAAQRLRTRYLRRHDIVEFAEA